MPAISTGLERLGYGGNDGCLALGLHRNVILSSEGATRTLLAKESGSLVVFDAVGTTTFNLPATPVVGMTFDFGVAVTGTGTWTISTGNAAIFMTGGVQIGSETLLESADSFAANGSSHYRIVMDADTKGRIKGGGVVRCVALSSTLWHVSGWLVGAGTLATPFA